MPPTTCSRCAHGSSSRRRTARPGSRMRACRTSPGSSAATRSPRAGRRRCSGAEPLRGALAVAARTQAERTDPWTEARARPDGPRDAPRAAVDARGPAPARLLRLADDAGDVPARALGGVALDRRRRLLEQHSDTALRAIEWAERYGDLDGDGFLEYRRASPEGSEEPGLEGLRRGDPLPGRAQRPSPDRDGRGAGVPLPRAPADGRDARRAR